MQIASSGILTIGLLLILGWAVLVTRGIGIVPRALRALALISFAIALSGPYREERHDENDFLALIDVSASVDDQIADRSIELLRRALPSGATVQVVPFSGESDDAGASLNNVRPFSDWRRLWERLDQGTTDLRSAVARHGLGGRDILLVTDGWESRGGAIDLVPQLASSGVRVFPFQPDERARSDERFSVHQLDAPLVAPAQKSVDIRVSLRNATGAVQRGKLEVLHDEKVVFSESVEVAAGRDRLITAQSAPSVEGIKEVTARLVPDNREFSTSSQTVFLSGETRAKVLLVSGAVDDERVLKLALSSQSYQLQSIGANQERVSLPQLSDYSAVLLNNIPLSQLEGGSATRIQQYVRGGGGLVMIGGNRSFGLGGYKDSPIEEALPVEMLPPQTEKKRVNVAVQLVLDKSRSMAEDNKIEFVKEASREVVATLKDEDLFGLIGFDTSPFIVVKMARLFESRDLALDRISRIFPSGRTNLLPAIEEGRRALDRAAAGRKHMIILTDGKIPDAGPFYVEIVKQMRLTGITLSTVMLGADSESLLRDMAESGGGSFYQTSDPNALPRIFVSDIKVSTGERTMKEQAEFQVRRGSGELRSTKVTSFPSLRGYVSTKGKAGANVELLAFSPQSAEPLLATWNYGDGRAIAFTSDANGRWSNSWVAWPGFQTFWSDVVESVQGGREKEEAHRFDLRTSVEGGNLRMDLSVFSDRWSGETSANITRPDGTTTSIPMSLVAAGRYAGELVGVKAGRYEVRVVGRSGKLTLVAFSLPGSLFGEQKGRGVNVTFLDRIASQTDGVVNPTSEQLSRMKRVATTREDLAPIFLVIALLAMLLEIVFREMRLRILGSMA